MKDLKLIECPRDAMQGIHEFIPSNLKANYINSLLKVGFDTLDFGSFVSEKAIPQLKDTADVLSQLDLSDTSTKLLSIVANESGAKDASSFDEIHYFGFPFSISEKFQLLNTNKTQAEASILIDRLLDICNQKGKELVVYLSMAFGNPYGEPWSIELVEEWTAKLASQGVKIINLSDTIGTSTPESINYLFNNLINRFPSIDIGAHLHTEPHNWHEKIDAAFKNGCRRFDGAIKGFGGCPMAESQLVGNMPTENLLTYFQEKKIETGINMLAFESAYNKAIQTFP